MTDRIGKVSNINGTRVFPNVTIVTKNKNYKRWLSTHSMGFIIIIGNISLKL